MEIYPTQHKILAALTKFIAIYRKNDDIMDISTNAAGDIEQLAFILVSVSNRSLSRVHTPVWKFLPLNIKFWQH